MDIFALMWLVLANTSWIITMYRMDYPFPLFRTLQKENMDLNQPQHTQQLTQDLKPKFADPILPQVKANNNHHVEINLNSIPDVPPQQHFTVPDVPKDRSNSQKEINACINARHGLVII
jgi:hypothetical protein